MKSYKSSYQDWDEYKREEEFLDNLQRYNKRLDEENITGILKQSAIENYIKDNALQYALKAI